MHAGFDGYTRIPSVYLQCPPLFRFYVHWYSSRMNRKQLLYLKDFILYPANIELFRLGKQDALWCLGEVPKYRSEKF